MIANGLSDGRTLKLTSFARDYEPIRFGFDTFSIRAPPHREVPCAPDQAN